MKEDNSYLTISKTALKIGVKPHVLRFWEKSFLIVNPKKKGIGGRRYYSTSDIEILLLIKSLLYTNGLTIKGAISFINEKYKNKINTSNHNLIITSKYPELIKAIDLIKGGNKILKSNMN